MSDAKRSCTVQQVNEELREMHEAESDPFRKTLLQGMLRARNGYRPVSVNFLSGMAIYEAFLETTPDGDLAALRAAFVAAEHLASEVGALSGGRFPVKFRAHEEGSLPDAIGSDHVVAWLKFFYSFTGETTHLMWLLRHLFDRDMTYVCAYEGPDAATQAPAQPVNVVFTNMTGFGGRPVREWGPEYLSKWLKRDESSMLVVTISTPLGDSLSGVKWTTVEVADGEFDSYSVLFIPRARIVSALEV